MRRRRTSRQSDLSTHDQIKSSSSSRNRQRRSRLLESLERREERLRRNSQSMTSRRTQSTRDQIDSMSSRNFLSISEQTEIVQIDVNTILTNKDVQWQTALDVYIVCYGKII